MCFYSTQDFFFLIHTSNKPLCSSSGLQAELFWSSLPWGGPASAGLSHTSCGIFTTFARVGAQMCFLSKPYDFLGLLLWKGCKNLMTGCRTNSFCCHQSVVCTHNIKYRGGKWSCLIIFPPTVFPHLKFARMMRVQEMPLQMSVISGGFTHPLTVRAFLRLFDL